MYGSNPEKHNNTPDNNDGSSAASDWLSCPALGIGGCL